MGEIKVPYQVVKDLIDSQNKVYESQLALLGEHLKECARLFELALNPPSPTYPTDEKSELFAHPRMSEDEEDLRHAFKMGDIDEVEFQRRLDAEFNDA